MRFLIIGISMIAGLLFTSCGNNDQIEYKMTVDFVYVNQANNTIRFSIREPAIGDSIDVKLNPKAQSSTFSYEISGAPKNPTPENCCQGVLEGNIAPYSIIILSDELYVVHENEKSVLISNYKDNIISDRHFWYTYTFTEGDLENALPCNGDCDDL